MAASIFCGGVIGAKRLSGLPLRPIRNLVKLQEPGGADDIAQTCHINYGVSFPMFGKIEVNGAATFRTGYRENQAPPDPDRRISYTALQGPRIAA
jgi:hypothetical protein